VAPGRLPHQQPGGPPPAAVAAASSRSHCSPPRGDCAVPSPPPFPLGAPATIPGYFQPPPTPSITRPTGSWSSQASRRPRRRRRSPAPMQASRTSCYSPASASTIMSCLRSSGRHAGVFPLAGNGGLDDWPLVGVQRRAPIGGGAHAQSACAQPLFLTHYRLSNADRARPWCACVSAPSSRRCRTARLLSASALAWRYSTPT
jgi:hypothetical protein